MQRTLDGRRRRGAALLAVLLAHALLAFLLMHASYPQRKTLALEGLSLIYLPPPEPTHSPSAPPERSASPSSARVKKRTPDAPGLPNEVTPTARARTPPSPTIDWQAEQERSAQAKSREIWKQLSQRCRDAEALHIYPPACHRYIEPEPWQPEEPRFGHAGPLPYVRLGQCVVGLGFWGCALGKPPPNGHAFDGMRDPDRPDSIPNNGNYLAPPEPREPLH